MDNWLRLEIERQGKVLEQIAEKQQVQTVDIALLKQHASFWGAVAGTVAGIITLIVTLIVNYLTGSHK